MRGKVLLFNNEHGRGKIIGEDGCTYFALYKNITGRKEKTLYRNEIVNFIPIKTDHKDERENDIAFEIEPCDITQSEIRIVSNPFTPDRPVNDSYYFAGRKAKIVEAVTCLENHKNILIEGERGIGKSSFANQVFYIASGDDSILDRYSITTESSYNYAPISIKLEENDDISEISEKIITEFVSRYGITPAFLVEHEIDLKFYKAKISANNDIEREHKITQVFIADLRKISDFINRKCGLFIFIDELETSKKTEGLASFIKNVSEYFVTERINILFVFSGIYSTSTRLFREHPSFLRLFTPIELGPFAPIESNELIDIYLYGRAKKINDIVKDNIAKIARGLPQYMQLIGYYCYQNDMDNYIKRDDLVNAVRYITSTIKKSEFQANHERIGYGANEEILKLLIKQSIFKDIKVDKVHDQLRNLDIREVVQAMEMLCEIGLLRKMAKGRYTLRDALFGQYLIDYYDDK